MTVFRIALASCAFLALSTWGVSPSPSNAPRLPRDTVVHPSHGMFGATSKVDRGSSGVTSLQNSGLRVARHLEFSISDTAHAPPKTTRTHIRTWVPAAKPLGLHCTTTRTMSGASLSPDSTVTVESSRQPPRLTMSTSNRGTPPFAAMAAFGSPMVTCCEQTLTVL